MDSIRLEPFGERHLDEVTAMLDDRDVRRVTRIPDPPPADFARQWLDRYRAGRCDGTREAFAALDGDGALTEAGALRARLVIDVANPASARVAERCGYVREGVMRSVYFKNGQRIDAGLWSRLPTDPDPRA